MLEGIDPNGATILLTEAVTWACSVAMSAGQMGPPGVLQLGSDAAEPAGFDRSRPRALSSCLRENAVHVDEAPHVDQAEEQEQEDRDDEGELDEALAAMSLARLRSRRVHRRFDELECTSRW